MVKTVYAVVDSNQWGPTYAYYPQFDDNTRSSRVYYVCSDKESAQKLVDHFNTYGIDNSNNYDENFKPFAVRTTTLIDNIDVLTNPDVVVAQMNGYVDEFRTKITDFEKQIRCIKGLKKIEKHL